MNQFDKNNDELRAFLSLAESEQTQVGFTGKLMELIKKEPLPVVKKRFGFLTIPVIYCTLLAILIIAALFIPNGGSETDNIFSWFPSFDNLLPKMPVIDLSIFSNITIPETLIYVMISCLALFIFDLFLFRHFNAANGN